MVKIKDITEYLEQLAPLEYQESYDNCGLITGDDNQSISGILITLDCTEDVVREAIDKDCNFIVAHHPIWFQPIKKLTGKSYVERTLILAIKHEIAIYAIHTNLDNVNSGVNSKLAEVLDLKTLNILKPKSSGLAKLVTFSPKPDTGKVLKALYQAGAGSIGNYEDCSFTTSGTGSFRPNQEASPYLGSKGQLEQVNENRIEVILPQHRKNQVISALKEAHPYEEVAYYVQELGNENQEVGSGMVGWLEDPMSPLDFLEFLKSKIDIPYLRHTQIGSDPIQKVGICGGAGSFLIKTAIAKSCDAFVTSDLKYHEFFDADSNLLLVDIGHYESEVFTKDLLFDTIKKKFSKFAVRLSKTDTNPIRYF